MTNIFHAFEIFLLSLQIFLPQVRDTFCSYGVMELCTRGLQGSVQQLRQRGVQLACVRTLVVVAEERPRWSFSNYFSLCNKYYVAQDHPGQHLHPAVRPPGPLPPGRVHLLRMQTEHRSVPPGRVMFEGDIITTNSCQLSIGSGLMDQKYLALFLLLKIFVVRAPPRRTRRRCSWTCERCGTTA